MSGPLVESIAHALGLFLIAYAAAAGAWAARGLRTGPRRAVLIPLAAVGFVVPCFAPDAPLWLKGAVVLECPLLAFRLLDLHIGIDDWRKRSLGEWLAYLLHPAVVVYRLYKRQGPKPRGEAALLLARGLLEIAAGAAVLTWAFGREWGGGGAGWFWVEHAVKLAGIYLCVLDGGFATLTGLCRLVGSPVADATRHPILAVTPADFWRRYNMEAGRLLHANMFVPLGGRSRPVPAMVAVFLINGVYHEYLASLMIGRVLGYQLAMFTIFGVAAAATWRWRPRGWAAVAGWAGTVVFMGAVSVLFFMSADAFMEWYTAEVPWL